MKMKKQMKCKLTIKRNILHWLEKQTRPKKTLCCRFRQLTYLSSRWADHLASLILELHTTWRTSRKCSESLHCSWRIWFSLENLDSAKFVLSAKLMSAQVFLSRRRVVHRTRTSSIWCQISLSFKAYDRRLLRSFGLQASQVSFHDENLHSEHIWPIHTPFDVPKNSFDWVEPRSVLRQGDCYHASIFEEVENGFGRVDARVVENDD